MTFDLASALRLKIGALNVEDGARTPFGARLAVFPARDEEAVEAVTMARQANVPIVPAGGGTSVDAVAPVPPDAMLLSSLRLNRITEHHPEDLVVSAQAGVTLAALQDALRRHGQFLPVNPPDPEAATLGGIVASASTGSWRAAYGPVRDYVLEVRGVDPMGRMIRAGARVVKNAAGYDLPKLYTGSHGTLAFLTEVTFRTRALPEQTTRLLFSAPDWDTVHDRLMALATSNIQPTALEVIRPDLRDERERPTGIITLEGAPDTVQWQATACMEMLRGGGATVGRLEDAAVPALPRTGDVELTIRVRPADTVEAVDYLTANQWRGTAAYYPMEGRIRLHLVAYPDTPEALAALRAWVEPRGGAVTIERMPLVWTGHVSPWGTPRADARLARAIKAQLDPDGLFINALPGA